MEHIGTDTRNCHPVVGDARTRHTSTTDASLKTPPMEGTLRKLYTTVHTNWICVQGKRAHRQKRRKVHPVVGGAHHRHTPTPTPTPTPTTNASLKLRKLYTTVHKNWRCVQCKRLYGKKRLSLNRKTNCPKCIINRNIHIHLAQQIDTHLNTVY